MYEPHWVKWSSVVVQSHMYDEVVNWCYQRFGIINDNSIYKWSAYIKDGYMQGIEFFFKDDIDAMACKLIFHAEYTNN